MDGFDVTEQTSTATKSAIRHKADAAGHIVGKTETMREIE
jgi:hypothetical protein